MQQNVEPSAIFLQAFNSVIRNFTGSNSQCFEAPTALSLSLMLSFYRANVELVFPTRVFPIRKPVFSGYFLLPEARFFQLPNPGISKILELLLHSNISDSDNTEVADWGV